MANNKRMSKKRISTDDKSALCGQGERKMNLNHLKIEETELSLDNLEQEIESIQDILPNYELKTLALLLFAYAFINVLASSFSLQNQM